MHKFGDPDEYGSFPYLYSGQWSESELNDLLEERLPESYNMQLVDPDEIEVLAQVVNQGIDSHLEAVTAVSEPKVVKVKAGDMVLCRKLEFIPNKAGMICLIRRLREYLNTCDDDLLWESAHNLISSIFESLSIEYQV
jgi:hypothetical protein